MRLFFIFENFSENWSFRPPRTCWHLWLNSHMCTLLIQMSEFLYFNCPEVKIWCFSSFSKSFQEMKKNGKNWSFPPPRTCRHFCLNLYMCTFSLQMSEFLYFSCVEVKIWWFSSISKTFQKIEKIKALAYHGPDDIFGSIHKCAFVLQISEFFYFSCVQRENMIIFSNFGNFLKNK